MIGPACDRVPMPEVDREAITAWRCWFVLPEECLLRPIYKRGLAWKPREALEAVCPDQLHEVPDDRCKCGVWAASAPENLHEVKWTKATPKGVDPQPGVLVVGQVSLWGRMIEYERGWRSSHAYPKHLYVFADDPALAAALRDTYLVPVEYGDKARELAEMFPKPADEEPNAPPALAVSQHALLGLPHLGLPQPPASMLALLPGLKTAGNENLRDRVSDLFSGWESYRGTPGRLQATREGVSRYRGRLAGARLRGRYHTQEPPFSGLRRALRSERCDMLESWAYLRVIQTHDAVTARRLAWWYLVHNVRRKRRSFWSASPTGRVSPIPIRRILIAAPLGPVRPIVPTC
jgi:hypothetical protein